MKTIISAMKLATLFHAGAAVSLIDHASLDWSEYTIH